MKVKRSILVSSFAAVGVMLMATSAWAWCTPYVDKSTTMSVSPSSAVAGTVVRVTGTHWAEGPVEARWGSPTGDRLGQATVGATLSFSMDVRIPNAAAGQHSIVVVHPPSVESQRSQPFTVLAPTESSADPASDGGTDAGTTSGRVGSPSPSPSSEPAATPGPTSSDAPAVAPATPSASGTSGEPGAVVATPSATSTQAAAGEAAAARPTVAAAPRGLGGRLVNPAPVASVAPGNAAQTPLATAVGEAGEAAAAAPSTRSALADLWGGFASGPDSSALGLVDVSTADGSAGDSLVSRPTILLPLGLMALFAGFGMAELSRRRATATSSR